MANLRFLETTKLEKLFRMGGGYVLDFTDRTFSAFVDDSVRKDIFDDKYDYRSGSKANRLRAFWTKEPNYIAGKLIGDLIEFCEGSSSEQDKSLIEDCRRIAERLRHDAPVPDLETLSPTDERDFDLLVTLVRGAIEDNQPAAGLDRLHTFVTKYLRRLCDKHGIVVTRDKALHSLMGEYVKQLRTEGLIESDMTERILKSSVSIMDAFNQVRNEQSLAHDNPVLNYDESMLIVGHVVGLVKFLEAIEARGNKQVAGEVAAAAADDDIPF